MPTFGKVTAQTTFNEYAMRSSSVAGDGRFYSQQAAPNEAQLPDPRHGQEERVQYQRQQLQKKTRITGRKMKGPAMSQGEQQTAKLLAQYLHQIIEGEKKVETRREVLAEILDFEPFSIYQAMLNYDPASRAEQVMRISCLKKFLEVNNAKSSYELLAKQDGYWQQLLRYQFKTVHPTQISYTEFLRIVLPIRKRRLRDRVLKKQ